METATAGPGDRWACVPISRIEDLHDAVLGAGLDVMQMSRAPITGSLAFAHDDGVLYSSGSIDGHVGLTGPLSESMVTLGVGMRLPPGTRHWLTEVGDRAIGVFLPGDEHESFYMPGSLYATATLSCDRLEEVAADVGMVLGKAELGGTGISNRKMEPFRVEFLHAGFERVHRDRAGPESASLGRAMLEFMVSHLAREPRRMLGSQTSRRHSQIVARARSYIAENLDEALTIDAIARAAWTSHRTLHRAFVEILDETPQSYTRKLRLNRIRQDLATEREAACTITLVANRWGINELGRLSGWYRELFGELPSQTRARSDGHAAGLARSA